MCILLFHVGGNILKQKITEEVIQKLRGEYVPGPFTPGFDPDKVNPNFLRHQKRKHPEMPTPKEWNEQWRQ